MNAIMDCNSFIEARWLGRSMQAFTPIVVHPIKMLPRMLITPTTNPRYPTWNQLFLFSFSWWQLFEFELLKFEALLSVLVLHVQALS